MIQAASEVKFLNEPFFDEYHQLYVDFQGRVEQSYFNKVMALAPEGYQEQLREAWNEFRATDTRREDSLSSSSSFAKGAQKISSLTIVHPPPNFLDSLRDEGGAEGSTDGDEDEDKDGYDDERGSGSRFSRGIPNKKKNKAPG